ncbi:uncharacterized protein LOC126350918 isoform X3 [Schistocerca gregaria]|uniref:uncharacterized protein LOC126350918 isoform X3 n=1 Tax=Schistocerca gregaria TaxID=7010 RepID=UPI00211DC089|nr:uncharacterized protein LOC126350918 isoform X3 [Schistocerca gregaria]
MGNIQSGRLVWDSLLCSKVCPDTMLLQDFPDEILLEIFSRLPVKDIVTCALYVCKRWKAVCRSSALWKGREYRLTDKKRKCEIVEVAKLIPHLTTLFVGTGTKFCVWFTGCNVLLSSGVDFEIIRDLVWSCNISNITVPRGLFSPDLFPKLLDDDKKLRYLTVKHDPMMYNTPGETLPLLLRQGSLSELKILHIHGARSITVDTVLQLCQHCPHLEELALHELSQASDHVLQNLQLCPKLRLLEITQSNSLRDLSFLKCCPNLLELDLTMCYSLQPSSFQHLLHLKKLKWFHMRHCRAIGLPLAAMAEYLVHLKIIDLFYSAGFSESELKKLQMIAPHIIVLQGPFDHR